VVKTFDIDLAIRDSAEPSFYAQFNKIDTINIKFVALSI
jgi:hypothetical protein